MPTYDFRCRDCGLVFEEVLSIHEDSSRAVCPECHDDAVKVLSVPAVRFAGGGWGGQ